MRFFVFIYYINLVFIQFSYNLPLLWIVPLLYNFFIFEILFFNFLTMKNAIMWFEIPTVDFERAVKFYKNIVKWEFTMDDSMWMKMAFFPYDRMEWVWWALINTTSIKPTKDWITVYFDAWKSIDDMVSLVAKNWWKMIMPKTSIWKEMWFIAQFIDTEWNRIGLHWMK